MKQILNLGSEAQQRHTIIFEESEIVLILRYLAPVQQWFFSVEYNNFNVHNVKLSVGVVHILSKNQPFDFVVTDNSGAGIDPFSLDDFASGRCSLFMLEPNDMFDIRGVDVTNEI
ncbi:MAG: hypothetical protein IBX55_08870 [Methyloprofundus sp.]|nr:hypothetical protein [Methyloprofundus sp.]